MYRLVHLVAGVVLALSVLVLSVQAQSATSASRTIQVSQVRGEILKRDSDTITIRSSGQVQQYIVPRNVKITRNTFGAGLDAIRPNDSVTLIVDPDGQVLSVDATSAAVSDASKWGIPLLVVIGIVAGASYLLYHRYAKGHPKPQPAA